APSPRSPHRSIEEHLGHHARHAGRQACGRLHRRPSRSPAPHHFQIGRRRAGTHHRRLLGDDTMTIDRTDTFAVYLSWARCEVDPDWRDDKQDEEIMKNIMELIVEECDFHIYGKGGLWEEPFENMSVKEHEFKPALTLRQAARFIYRAMEQVERETHELCT